MSDNKYNNKPREKTAMDMRKLKLSTDSVVPGKKAQLVFGIHANNPRVTVYTGDPSEASNDKAGYGKIQANLDAPIFETFIGMIEHAATVREEWSAKIENKNYTWYSGKRSDKPVLLSELWVGRSKDGLVWVSVISADQNRPKLRFYFTPSEFHHFVKRTGEPFAKDEVNNLYALGYARLLRGVSQQVLVNHYVDETPKDNGNNGNNNFRQNPRNTEKSKDAGFSSGGDDLPW